MELAVRPHLMSDREKQVIKDIAPGTTVQKAIDQLEFIDPRVRKLNLAVFIDGIQLEREYWAETIITDDLKKVEVCAVLQGGRNGKAILATIAIIILAVMSKGWSLTLTGEGGMLAGMSATTVQAGIMIVGSLAINAVFAPPAIKANTESAQGDTSKAYTFGGQNNSVRPFQPLTRVYGRHRVSPDVAAMPYTVNLGESSFFYGLYSFGYGPLHLEDFKIGTNPLTNYSDYQINVIENYTHPSQLIYYKSDVWQDGYDQKITVGSPATAVTRQDTESAVFDIFFVNGLGYINDQGGVEARTVTLVVEYAKDNSGAWQRADLKFNSAGFSATITGSMVATQEEVDRYTEGEGGIGFYALMGGMFSLPAGATEAGIAWWAGGVEAPGQPAPVGTKLHIGPYTVTVTESTQNHVKWAEPLPGVVSGDPKAGQLLFTWQGAYPNIGAENEVGVWTITLGKRGQFMASAKIDFPQPGTYTVRVSTSADIPDDGRTMGETHFVALKSMKSNPPVLPEVPMTMVELVIKATGQLNGAVEQFSALATSILPVWDGSVGGFVPKPTRNPAWIYLDLLSGVANRRRMAYSRIDIDKLKEWATYCESPNNPPNGSFNEPIGTCDVIIDKAYTLWELLQSVATCGRATPTMKDNKYSVIIDSASRTPVQMFTPRNSWNLRSTRSYMDKPHALRVKWIDPDQNWGPAELTVYNTGQDVNTATKFEELATFGMTRAEQVLRYGRYMLAQGQLRLERFQIETDIESIVCVRGDLVHVAHDVIEVGGEANRIHAISTDRRTITADMGLSIFDMFEQGVPMGVRIRKDTGLLTVVLVVTAINNDLGTVTLSAPLEAGVQVGDLFVYGQRSAVTGQYTVDKVIPNQDMGATVHLEEYAPLVYSAEANGVFPPYVPQGGGSFTGPAPQNLTAQIVEYIESNVDPRCVVVLTWAPPEGSDRRPPENYRIWAVSADGSEAFEGQVNALSYRDGDVSLFRFGGTARIYRVRAFHPAYGLSNPAEVALILPQRNLRPPIPPDIFTVQDMPNGIRKYAWSYFRVPEGWAGVRIRYIAGTVPNPVWELMNDLQPGGASMAGTGAETALPPGQGPMTFSCRTVDVNGTLSDHSKNVSVTLSLSSLDGGGAALPTNASPPPNPPDNFILDSGISLILIGVSGESIQYTEGGGHAYTEVYGLIYNGGPLPSVGSATKLGTFTGTAGNLAAEPGVTYRIWLRNVARNGKQSVGFGGGANGKPVTTAVDPGLLLDLLTGQITEGQLYQSLNSRINLIDGDGPGSVNTRDKAWFDQLNTKFTQQFQVTTNELNRIDAQYTVKIDVNGYVVGYGLLATNNNGQLSSQFVVRADQFFIGAPGADADPNVRARAPFIVQTVDTNINGVFVPKGVYMHQAYIQNATITEAKIANGAITNLKIGNFICSFQWNGQRDANGNITGVGDAGWAIDKQGTAVFHNIHVRKHIDPDSRQQIFSAAQAIWNYGAAIDGNSVFTDGGLLLYFPAYHASVPTRQRVRRIYGDTPIQCHITFETNADHFVTIWGRWVTQNVPTAWQAITTGITQGAGYGPLSLSTSLLLNISGGPNVRSFDDQYYQFGVSAQNWDGVVLNPGKPLMTANSFTCTAFNL
jgi:sulfur carrier protein ThiS